MRINVIFDHFKMYYYKAQTVCYSLRKMGIESDLYCPFPCGPPDDIYGHRYPNADYYFILNNLHFDDSIIPEDCKTIWSCNLHVDFDSDHPDIQRMNEKFTENCGKHDLIVTTCPLTKDEMATKLPIHGLVGFYDDNLEEHIIGDDTEKNNDIIFCGNLYTQRRQEFIMSNLDACSIEHVDNSFFEEYYRELAKSKISINVLPYSYDEAKTCFGFLRIANAMLQKSLVISEPIKNSDPLISAPFVYDRNFVETPLEDMMDVCQYYLENEQARETIVNNAFRHIKHHYRMDDMLHKLIVNNIDSGFERQDLDVELPRIKGVLQDESLVKKCYGNRGFDF